MSEGRRTFYTRWDTDREAAAFATFLERDVLNDEAFRADREATVAVARNGSCWRVDVEGTEGQAIMLRWAWIGYKAFSREKEGGERRGMDLGSALGLLAEKGFRVVIEPA